MSKPIIEVNGVSKHYKLGVYNARSLVEQFQAFLKKQSRKATHTFTALDQISFTIDSGEVVGVIGANGAGKSTLLKVLSRITTPDEGEIIARGKISSLLEVGTGMHPELTGRENIYLNGSILGMTKNEINAKIDEIIEFSEIGEHIDTPVKRYSSGMNVRLGFAVAAHLEPDILIIDEVLAVGDINFQKKCLAKVKSIANKGLTVLFVSHNMSLISSICSRCIMLDKGKVLIDDSPSVCIDKYLSKNASNQKHLRDITADSDIQLHNIRVENLDNADNLYSGCRAKFSIDYQIHKREFKDLSFALTCYTESMQPLFRLNTKFSDPDINLQDSGTISVVVDQLLLGQGTYNFSIFCRDNFGNHMVKQYFEIDNAITIDVYDTGYLKPGIVVQPNIEGSLLIKQSWQYEE